MKYHEHHDMLNLNSLAFANSSVAVGWNWWDWGSNLLRWVNYPSNVGIIGYIWIVFLVEMGGKMSGKTFESWCNMDCRCVL